MSGRFGFFQDSLFLFCSGSYLVNRWCLKPVFHGAFLRNWFSDLLLAPCAIPIVLWIFRKTRLRSSAEPPTLLEMAWILTVWSVLFEWAGPKVISWSIADWRDVVMYWAGGLAAWCFWNFRYGRAGEFSHEL